MMYGKEVQGTIRSTVIIGPKGDVLRHWTTVKKAESHPMDVLDYFQAADRRVVARQTSRRAARADNEGNY